MFHYLFDNILCSIVGFFCGLFSTLVFSRTIEWIFLFIERVITPDFYTGSFFNYFTFTVSYILCLLTFRVTFETDLLLIFNGSDLVPNATRSNWILSENFLSIRFPQVYPSTSVTLYDLVAMGASLCLISLVGWSSFLSHISQPNFTFCWVIISFSSYFRL